MKKYIAIALPFVVVISFVLAMVLIVFPGIKSFFNKDINYFSYFIIFNKTGEDISDVVLMSDWEGWYIEDDNLIEVNYGNITSNTASLPKKIVTSSFHSDFLQSHSMALQKLTMQYYINKEFKKLIVYEAETGEKYASTNGIKEFFKENTTYTLTIEINDIKLNENGR